MLSSRQKIVSYALASLGVIGLLLLHIPYGATYEPDHAQYGAYDPTMFARGGWNLTADAAAEMLDRWVVLLRRPVPPNPIPPREERQDGRIYMPENMGYMSLGYGLYFRRPGFMLASLRNVLSGARRTKEKHYELDAYYIHKNEKYHHEPMDNASSPLVYKPYKLINMKHVYTFSGTDLAVFRVTMSGYKDLYTPNTDRAPYERYLDYPQERYLPDIATETDQRNSCYVIIHSGFDGDKMGYNEYLWKYWPIEVGRKLGPRAWADPHWKRLRFSPKYIDPNLQSKHDTRSPGRICPVIHDFGAPVLCHTEDYHWDDGRGNKTTRAGRKWKLAYMLLTLYNFRNECHYAGMPLFDLTHARETLMNQFWEDNIGSMW